MLKSKASMSNNTKPGSKALAQQVPLAPLRGDGARVSAAQVERFLKRCEKQTGRMRIMCNPTAQRAVSFEVESYQAAL